MLFLHRPRQTRMPYVLPAGRMAQADHNRQLQRRFTVTRRVPPAAPATVERDTTADQRELDELHRVGALSDAEVAAARAKLVPS